MTNYSALRDNLPCNKPEEVVYIPQVPPQKNLKPQHTMLRSTPSMECNTDPKTEDQYWLRLYSTQRQWHPGVVSQLSSQDGVKGHEGRVALIKFQNDAKPSVEVFTNLEKLRRHFTDPVSPHAPTCSRMFVLEGLPRNFIHLLGSRLKVPPSFFAEHWVKPGEFVGSLLNHTPRYYNNHSRFTLAFPKLHWAQIKQKPGERKDPTYLAESSIYTELNYITLFGECKDPLWSFENMSFWRAGKDADERWDGKLDSFFVTYLNSLYLHLLALLLVDPPLLRVDPPLKNYIIKAKSRGNVPEYREVEPKDPNLLDTARDDITQDGSWYPPFPEDIATETPKMESMFADIVSLYPFRQCQSDSNPIKSLDAIDICRQLVLSAWTARLRIMEAEVVRKQFYFSTRVDPSDFNPDTWLDKSWTRAWTERDFGGLVRAKNTLEATEMRLFYTIDALKRSGDSHAGKEWEADAWHSLQIALQTLKTRVNLMLEAYTQSVSVRESKQVGFLTSLAALFVPISLIAAVFSMGGNYAADQPKFYVFWAISLPIMVLACLYLFRDSMLSLLRKRFGTSVERRQGSEDRFYSKV
ncbi:hypothetical protein FALBO_12018 [Fusarium albosuccineum]|uniref:Uncharacterized protein n=1 Tax=Fusarium albosuccineum TaxID=1237068 RepID=A0A8H4PHH4_9HYPO|nr:hypothetical protein FALBO_12018 [Fusarium albosuccineum]